MAIGVIVLLELLGCDVRLTFILKGKLYILVNSLDIWIDRCCGCFLLLLLFLLLLFLFYLFHYLICLLVGRNKRWYLHLGCYLTHLESLFFGPERFRIDNTENSGQHNCVTGDECAMQSVCWIELL